MQPFSLSQTPTLLSHTHLNSESVAVAALPEALAQWMWLELPPVLPDGWRLCLCVCVRGSRCPCLPVSGLSACFLSPHLQLSVSPSSAPIHPCCSLSLPPSLSLPLLSLPESWGHCRTERCCFLFSCSCQFSPFPLQDKSVIAPGTAGLSSSSSKQICCNFICNWALNWEQIEAALWSSGKGEGSELGVCWGGRGNDTGLFYVWQSRTLIRKRAQTRELLLEETGAPITCFAFR